jgi:gamma-glutamyl-gamma-aminobutyrate hydrolase PuuD
VIGIITLQSPESITMEDPDIQGMIPSSYKKWVELTGARTIVIPHYLKNKHLKKLIGQVNGLVFPGGAPRLVE